MRSEIFAQGPVEGFRPNPLFQKGKDMGIYEVHGEQYSFSLEKYHLLCHCEGMRAIRSATTVLARFFLSAIFLAAGIDKIFHWQETETFLLTALSEWQTHVSYFPRIQESIAGLIPWTPLLLLLATLFELIGGLLVLLGIKEKWGAGLLVLFLIPTTLLFHSFWFLDGVERELQQTMFLKNVSILGGLLMVTLYGATAAKNDGFSSDSFKY